MVDTQPASQRTAAMNAPAPAAPPNTVETPAEAAATPLGESTCLWCGHSFEGHRGGSPQRFCSAQHRNEFWSSLRHWGERAVASGILTVDHIRNVNVPACTLLPGAAHPVPVSEAGQAAPASPAPAQRPDEAAGLLEDLLIALTDLPQEEFLELARNLPRNLFDRVAFWIGKQAEP
jgi:hypothetical protein